MSARSWTRKETTTLIDMYRNFRELWDSSCSDYKDKEKRNYAFGLMSETFGTTVEEVNRKIHNMRCQLNSEIRKINKRGKSVEDSDCSSWEYFHSFKFCIGLNSDVTPNTISIKIENDTENDTDDPLAVHTKNRKRQKTPKNNKLKRKISSLDSYNHDQEHEYPATKSVSTATMTSDDHQLFGEYVATELRNLNTFHAKKLKVKIRRAILEVTEEAFEQEQRNKSLEIMIDSSSFNDD